MKLLVFVLIVIGVIVVSVSVDGKIECLECANCLSTGDKTTKSNKDCTQCGITIDDKVVKRACFKTDNPCKQQLTGFPVVKCCNNEDNCNNKKEELITKPFKCYKCTECPNPFPKEGGTKSEADECVACMTTTTADKKINKDCIKSTDTPCATSNNDGKKVECCNADLCNAGVSHSTKKFVLVGLLALAIGAIRY